MPWLQNYDPLNSEILSTLVAALPIIVLLGLLGSGRVTAHVAAAAGLITAMLAAVFVFHIQPVRPWLPPSMVLVTACFRSDGSS